MPTREYTYYEGSNSAKAPDTVRYDWATQNLTVYLSSWNDGSASFAGLPSEQDTLIGIENAWGGSGRDLISGSEANNELRGGGGADTLIGNAGDDTLWGMGGTDSLDGGAGSDTVVYADNTTPVRVDLATGQVSFIGQTWQNEILRGIENVVAGTGNDILLGSAGGNVFDGGLGVDTIDGKGGSDTVSYASHAQAVQIDLAQQRGWIIGTAPRDTLISIESAQGGDGNDRLVGNGGANRLDGGAGNDTISGGAGNDTVLLSAGIDSINGGGGSDTLEWNIDYDKYYNLNYVYSYDDYYGIVSDRYSGSIDDDVFIDLSAGSMLSAYFGGSGSISNVESVTTGVGNDHVIGSNAANTISVGRGANYVDARGGNDVIYGSNVDRVTYAYFVYFVDDRDESEILIGGLGNDTIVGGSNSFGDAGNDRLVSGWGLNVMTGGTGADRFVFSTEYDQDGWRLPVVLAQHGSVTDFNSAEGDRVEFDLFNDGELVPTFVGRVDEFAEVNVGEYAIVGEGATDVLFVPMAYEYGYSSFVGMTVEVGANRLTEADIIFV